MEIGEGGTKGKLSRMESARVEVVSTDDIEMRLPLSALSSFRARACWASRAPAALLAPVWIAALLFTTGDTSFALVMRNGVRGVLSAALTGVCGMWAIWSKPRWTRLALLMSATIAEACVYTLEGRSLSCDEPYK